MPNFIRHVDVGIGSNHVDGVAHAPRLTVRGNELRDVDVGMNLSGLADGSLIELAHTAHGSILDRPTHALDMIETFLNTTDTGGST